MDPKGRWLLERVQQKAEGRVRAKQLAPALSPGEPVPAVGACFATFRGRICARKGRAKAWRKMTSRGEVVLRIARHPLPCAKRWILLASKAALLPVPGWGFKLLRRRAKGWLQRSRSEVGAMFARPVWLNRNLARYAIYFGIGGSDHEQESCNADYRKECVHELQIRNKFGDIHSCCLSKQRAYSFNISYQ
jgi:hypothetical protein